MPWYQKTITAGPLIEIRHYFATRDGRAISRGPNMEASSEAQVQANQQNAEMELCRLIACNFGGELGGGSYTFKSREGLTEEEAQKRERNLLDRIKRLRKRKGLEPLRYIATLEKQGRWHHHIVMQDDMSLQELTELWGELAGEGSRVHVRAVTTDAEGYMEIARYMLGIHKERRDGTKPGENTKQQRRKWQRRWHASKGLNRPKVEKKPVKRQGRWGQATAPKGCRLLDLRQWVDALGNICTAMLAVRDETVVVQRSRKAAKRPKGSGACPGGSEGRALQDED